jgi:hypothetical protein
MADVVDRYVRLAQGLGWTSPALSPAELKGVIQSSPANKDQIAEHVAKHSWLTFQAARAAVDRVPIQPDNVDASAKQLSAALAEAAFSGELTLSEPDMLSHTARGVAAVLFGLVLAAVLAGIVVLAALDRSNNWAYGGLGAAALACLLAILLMVLGYKNVTIKGSGPAGPA